MSLAEVDVDTRYLDDDQIEHYQRCPYQRS